MSTTTDIIPAARWDLPVELLERGSSLTLRLRLYRGGEAAPPSVATVSVYDSGDAALVDEAAASIADGVASVVTAAITATTPLGTGYRVVWTADGRTYDIPAYVVRRILYPTVTDLDVRRRWSYLDSGTPATLTRASTWQDLIDDAWLTIQHRLIETGRLPWLVLSPSSLREPHLLLTGARIHDVLAARGNPIMRDRASQLHAQYEAAWARVSMRYDDDDDGREDRTASAGTSLWLGGAYDWSRP